MSSYWPDGFKFALALSHDVDRTAKRGQFIYYLAQAIARRDWRRLRLEVQSLQALLRGQDPYWTFEHLMSLEEGLRVRSTFFFLDESGKPILGNPKSFVLFWGRYRLEDARIQKVIRMLDAGGWEIGLHGSYYSYNNEELLKREKGRLEAILGHAVIGVRQHYLRLEIPTTWQIHSRLGFAYDSTWGFCQQIGFRGDHLHPFFPEIYAREASPLLQIPMVVMDGPLMECYQQPWEEVCALIQRAERAGGILTLNWHQHIFNPWWPDERPAIYPRIIQECQQRGAWVTTLGEVAHWWCQRYAKDEGQFTTNRFEIQKGV